MLKMVFKLSEFSLVAGGVYWSIQGRYDVASILIMLSICIHVGGTWKKYSQEDLFEMIRADIKGSQSLLQSITHPAPEAIERTEIELINQTNKKANAILLIEAGSRKYKYSITADGKYGVSYIFGWENIKAESVVSYPRNE